VTVSTSYDDRILTVTLDSPANRNALSVSLVTGLADALTAAASDERVHGVVLTHTGPAFCSGADLSQTPENSTEAMLGLIRQILMLPIPVVAVVDGATRAGGLGILGACDVVLATAESTFAFTEVRLGLAPAIISLPLRPVLTSRGASRYFQTGEKFSAATACTMGLITAVDEPVEPVLEGLRAADRQGLAATRPLTTRDRLRELDAEGKQMAELSSSLFASPVAHAHFAAFFESRRKR
jgi:enoyl-CoA hydratase